MQLDPTRSCFEPTSFEPIVFEPVPCDPLLLEAFERLAAPRDPRADVDAGETRRPVSIRAIDRSRPDLALAERIPCAQCARSVLVSGPTGHVGDDPICDACLLDADEFLGMVVILGSISRGFGGISPADVQEERSVARQLLSFARLYARFAERRGPGRPPLEPKPA